jgi:hypothetical protein
MMSGEGAGMASGVAVGLALAAAEREEAEGDRRHAGDNVNGYRHL